MLTGGTNRVDVPMAFLSVSNVISSAGVLCKKKTNVINIIIWSDKHKAES